MLGYGGPASGLSGLRNWADERLFGADAKRYQLERAFEVNEAFETYAKTLSINGCQGDVECLEKGFDLINNDKNFQRQIERANALGAWDEAQTRTYVKLAIDKVTQQYDGVITSVSNLEETVIAAYEQSKSLMIQGFQQINQKQNQIIYNTAKILQVEQEHTIALQNIQNTIDANFEMIHQGIGNVVELQHVNLFLSEIAIEGIILVDEKIENLTLDVEKIRSTQIKDIFNNSPLNKKIQLLKNPKSNINNLLTNQQRLDLLENLRAIKLRKDIAKTSKLVVNLGKVAKDALDVFCEDCPKELSQAIKIGMGVADIVGNIATGNFAKAALSAIGLFKKPEPSPELKMLMQISKQLKGLEENMNAQFKAVHEHLFATEENLIARFDNLEIKIDQIAKNMLQIREEVLASLGGIDAKLSYIIKQNECIKDMVLTLNNQQNQDMCKVPVAEFQKSLAESSINSFQDLDNFFRGGAFSSCIQNLFDAANVHLLDIAFFRYAQCSVEGEDNKTNPNRVYDYLYHDLFGDQLNDPVTVSALQLIPVNVNVVDSISYLIENELSKEWITLNQEDKFYKNYQAVLAFSEYILSLFPFMELYDNGVLMTPERVAENPGFTRDRAIKLIGVLQSLISLVDHTYLQQSLMSGNGSFKLLDQRLAGTQGFEFEPSEKVFFSIQDLFTYNPYLRKNYSAYLLDRVVGYPRLAQLINEKVLEQSPQRFIYKGFSIQLKYDSNKQPIFIVNLTNTPNPAENLELFRAYLPVVNGEIDEDLYQQYLKFAFPSSLTEIEMMRSRLIEKLGEMYLVTSSTLDDENAEFTREEFEMLIRQYNVDRRQ